MNNATKYILKRKLARIAWRVYQSSLQDGNRLTAETKARRYVELVCLLFDSNMLTDVLALRMTCKSNCLRRRFPVCCVGVDEGVGVLNEELEANLIEEFVGYASSRFVSTAVAHAVTSVHHYYSTKEKIRYNPDTNHDVW